MEIKVNSETNEKYVVRSPRGANQRSGNVTFSIEEYTQLINEKVDYIITLRDDLIPGKTKITEHMLKHVKVCSDYVLVPVSKRSNLYPRSK